MFYWIGIVTQADLSVNMCSFFQQLNGFNNLYMNLPPEITTDLKKWNFVHIYLIGMYVNSISQKNKCGKIL